MTTHEIHGTTHRIISPNAIEWLKEKILTKIASNDPWRGRFVDAIIHLAGSPVKCERRENGTYRAAFASSRNASIEWIATENHCDCTAGQTGRACWHRAACILLRQVDRWEKNEMRKEFRVTTPACGHGWGLKYKGVRVEGIEFDSFTDAVQGVKLSIEQTVTGA
jgi:hypothetical protein